MAEMAIESGPFEPTWESLRTFQCPEWFRDAKFGIWAHWGPQCVPMFGDWYARNLYIEGHDQYRHHWRVYGHPSRVGYKDIVPLWKAERFDPDDLMDRYVRAGAKYFVAQAIHHDNFDNWDSAHNPWNAVRVGPKKNIVQLWQDAARKRDLPFGLSEHLGATYKWFATNKGHDEAGPYAGVDYDGNDPQYEDLYLPNAGEVKDGWYTDNPWWHERWFNRIKDLLDQHAPDLLYSDGGVPFYRVRDGVLCESPGLHAIAHLYNLSVKRHGGANRAVYTQKDVEPETYRVGVLDIERGMQAEIAEDPWQTDTCVGGWFYDVRRVYKTPDHVLAMLVNIVSKNGNLLLNLPQRPDGTLDDECLDILDRLAEWTAVCGEGIYSTRPWRVPGEGPGLAGQSGAFKEDAQPWTPEDFRFTAKGDETVYAFQMAWPGDRKATIRELAAGAGRKVAGVDLLGHDGPVTFRQGDAGLEIDLPGEKPCEGPHVFRVRLV